MERERGREGGREEGAYFVSAVRQRSMPAGGSLAKDGLEREGEGEEGKPGG